MRGALLVADGELGSLHEAAEHASAIGGREAAALRVQLVELDRQRVAEAAAGAAALRRAGGRRPRRV